MDPFLLLLFFLHDAVHAEDPDVISSKPGDDVTLPCRSTDPNIVAVEWTSPDRKPEHVFLYIDGHFKPQKQHPSFQGRVQLVDRDLKDGDASLTLKNVSSSDVGTYECRLKVDDSTRQKRAIIDGQPIRRVRLQVTGGEAMKGGAMKGDVNGGANTVVYVGSAAAFLLCLCAGFVLGKYRRRLMEMCHKLRMKQREFSSVHTVHNTV